MPVDGQVQLRRRLRPHSTPCQSGPPIHTEPSPSTPSARTVIREMACYQAGCAPAQPSLPQAKRRPAVKGGPAGPSEASRAAAPLTGSGRAELFEPLRNVNQRPGFTYDCAGSPKTTTAAAAAVKPARRTRAIAGDLDVEDLSRCN